MENSLIGSSIQSATGVMYNITGRSWKGDKKYSIYSKWMVSCRSMPKIPQKAANWAGIFNFFFFFPGAVY